MRTNQDIIFGVTGQVLTFDAPEGRPSSVTSCQIFSYSSTDDDAVLTGSGAVETSPNTTIDDLSGYGRAYPKVLNVASTTGLTTTGRSYLITSAAGHREWFEVEDYSTDTTVTAKHPLHNAYTTGDTVQSTRLQATVDPTWVADETNLDDTAGPNPAYRVRWVYVVSGTTYVADTYFNLVRYAGQHGVRPLDVEAIHPGWLDRLPTDHRNDQGRRLVTEAHRSVTLDLHAIWTDDAMIANAEIIDELTRWKCIELTEFARLMSGGGSAQGYELARSAYSSRLDQLARVTAKIPVRDHTGAAATTVSLGLSRR